MTVNKLNLCLNIISFHHTKGWVNDYEYPEKGDQRGVEIDEERLPTLCLPDQSHNFKRDSVFFILPTSENKRIFGKFITKYVDDD